MLVLPSSALITPFSAEENNIEWCDVRSAWLCVKVPSESSADERFRRKQKIFVRVKGKKRTTLSPSRVLFLFIIRRQRRYFSPPFLTQIDGALWWTDWKRKHNWNSSDFFSFLWLTFSREPRREGGKKKLTTFREPSRIRILLLKKKQKATLKTPLLPFLPMTFCDFSISCESFVIRRERAAIPVRPPFRGTRCVPSATHRWSATSVRGCLAKAGIARWQKDRRENANAKEHVSGHGGGHIKKQIKHTSYEQQCSYFCGSLG